MTDDLERRRRKVEDLKGAREQRVFDSELELRDSGTGTGGLTLVGHAAVTGVWYDVGGAFRERVLPQAFKRTLSESPDVQLLLNHGRGGSGLPLARTGRKGQPGTMRLSEDTHGLYVEADLDPEDEEVRTLQRRMARMDVDQMSIAFLVTADSWSDALDERTIKSLSLNRGDVSVVNQAASPTTHAEIVARSVPDVVVPDFTTSAKERLAVLGVHLRPPVRSGARPDEFYARRIRELREHKR